jgi:hypothetical protein
VAFVNIGETVKFKFKSTGETFSGVVKNYAYNNNTYNTKRRLYLSDVKSVATGVPYKVSRFVSRDGICISIDRLVTE